MPTITTATTTAGDVPDIVTRESGFMYVRDGELCRPIDGSDVTLARAKATTVVSRPGDSSGVSVFPNGKSIVAFRR